MHEVVVVDDGSTDETPSLIERLGAGIRYHRQANAGPSAARNTGIGLARGDLVAFLDADDEWLPTTLERMLEAFERRPDLGLVTADKTAVDDNGQVLVTSWLARNGLRDLIVSFAGGPVPQPVARLMQKNFVSTSIVLIPRQVLIEATGFPPDIRYGEDLLLWVKIAARHPIVCLPDVLGLYRMHADNATKSIEPMLKDYVKVAQRVREWGAALLAEQGASADKLVAAAWSDLGYWYFSQDRIRDARHAFLASLREAPIGRSLLYGAFSLLPVSAVRALRTVKQWIEHRSHDGTGRDANVG